MDYLNQIVFNEFDYLALTEVLKSYKYPKDKITKLLKKGRIVKIKRGLYVHGFSFKNRAYSKEILANLLYGPSYISLEYALAYYNMIPERVEVVTSVTMKRRKQYNTPLGLFTYYALNKKYYSAGISWKRLPDGRGFFIATPEKALIDKLYFDTVLPSEKAMRVYLLENLRIEEQALRSLKIDDIGEMLAIYKKKSLNNLLNVLKK